MRLADVLKKERERRKLTAEEVGVRLGIQTEQYRQIEEGEAPTEEWGPRLALIAITLRTPTSRLIAETGKSAQAKQVEGQCGKLIKLAREKRGFSRKELAEKIGISVSEIESIEHGITPIEIFGPILLSFAEMVGQPIFNFFYPCGLPLAELTDYP